MGYIKYFVFFIFSIFLTLFIAIVDAVVRNNLVAGTAGLPLRFSESALFGGGETNYINFSIDVLFWFVLLIAILKYFPLIFKFRK